MYKTCERRAYKMVGLDYSIDFVGKAISTIIIGGFIFGMGVPFLITLVKLIVMIFRSLFKRKK